MLKVEFEHICQSLIGVSHAILKDKKKKVRRKVVTIMTTQSEVQVFETVDPVVKQSLNSKIEFDIYGDIYDL